MIANYYTLLHISTEFEREFTGLTIEEIYTQNRGELVISFRENPSVIIIGCEPSNNYACMRKTFNRARKNSTAFFTEINGSTVKNVFIDAADRQIYFRLSNAYQLTAQFFGSKANVLLTDPAGTILSYFLKKTDSKTGQSARPSITKPTITAEAFLSDFGDQPITASLKKVIPVFGTVLLQELLTRAGLNGKQAVSDLTKNDVQHLFNCADRMKEELLTKPSPRIYFDNASPVCFAVIPLEHMNNFEYKVFDSVSEAISIYLAKAHRDKTTLHEKEEIIKVLERERDHTDRTLNKIAAETETINRADLHEKYGKLLMAQLHLFEKGASAALVEDYINGSGELIEIPIDKHLTPAKNAERYFEKAEKSRTAVKEQKIRVAELKQRQKMIGMLLDQIDEVAADDDLHLFTEENIAALSQFGLKSKKSGHVKKEEPPPFRVFTVAGGFQVWAGKSGENNDLLTTRHTAKNDLWFHARGVGGSHVVLKINTGKGEVSKQAIEQAAAIAAYYSKMKSSKLVPVAMCEGKFVRKPKGVPAGTVTLEREKTIFAEPGLPQPH